MVVIEGKNGSVTFFWKNKLVMGIPLGKWNMKDYTKLGDDLILKYMRENNMKVIEIIQALILWCNTIMTKKVRNKPLSDTDLKTTCIAIMSLIKLKIVDKDEVLLIMSKKKKNKGVNFTPILKKVVQK
jgi:hypothetical protein